MATAIPFLLAFDRDGMSILVSDFVKVDGNRFEVVGISEDSRTLKLSTGFRSPVKEVLAAEVILDQSIDLDEVASAPLGGLRFNAPRVGVYGETA